MANVFFFFVFVFVLLLLLLLLLLFFFFKILDGFSLVWVLINRHLKSTYLLQFWTGVNELDILSGVARGGAGGQLPPLAETLPPLLPPKWNYTLYRGLWRAAILSPSQPPPCSPLSPPCRPSFWKVWLRPWTFYLKCCSFFWLSLPYQFCKKISLCCRWFLFGVSYYVIFQFTPWRVIDG